MIKLDDAVIFGMGLACGLLLVCLAAFLKYAIEEYIEQKFVYFQENYLKTPFGGMIKKR